MRLECLDLGFSKTELPIRRWNIDADHPISYQCTNRGGGWTLAILSRDRGSVVPLELPGMWLCGHGSNRSGVLGNSVVSLTFSLPRKDMVNRSMPRQNPPCGGTPNLNGSVNHFIPSGFICFSFNCSMIFSYRCSRCPPEDCSRSL